MVGSSDLEPLQPVLTVCLTSISHHLTEYFGMKMFRLKVSYRFFEAQRHELSLSLRRAKYSLTNFCKRAFLLGPMKIWLQCSSTIKVNSIRMSMMIINLSNGVKDIYCFLNVGRITKCYQSIKSIHIEKHFLKKN